MKKLSSLVAIYSVTLLLSATLLFSVQPMFSKMVLPLLGGTPQVWNTAMLFFQLMLLGGYAYAHGTTKYLSIRAQAILHAVLLLVFTVVLPIVIPPDSIPPAGEDPIKWQLGLMLMTVGGPFFVIAGSAPMLQRWFSVSGHKDADNPYFLYGASNLGSMTALLAYPVLFEPAMTLNQQSHAWMYGYFGLIVFTVISALMVWPHAAKVIKSATANIPAQADDAPVTWKQRRRWLFLAFVPSSLMLGVTTYITMDIASVPLLWILPLAAYVGTFIIVFARKEIITSKQSAQLQGILLIMLVAQKMTMPVMDPMLIVLLYLALFFFSALTCHLELAKSRPSSRHLTEFYLMMSIGGALGGFFNAIIAPVFLVVPIEFVIVLMMASLIRYESDPGQKFSDFIGGIKRNIKDNGFDAVSNVSFVAGLLIIFLTVFSYQYPSNFVELASTLIICIGLSYILDRRWIFTILITFVFLFYPLGYVLSANSVEKVIHRDRNFFGILKVVDNNELQERMLLNGTTNHGTQALDAKDRLTPLSYYSVVSPLRDAVKIMDKKPAPQKFGVIGLGVGVTSCLSKPGRSFDFYEINALVKEIAENTEYFTFLKDCGSPYNIVLGDGRLTLQKAQDHEYNLMIIDAFTSDNIPLHLMTVEALKLYMHKIKDDGILMVHISNRFLDLEPVLQKASEAMQVTALAKAMDAADIPGTKLKSYGSHWVAFATDKQILQELRNQGWDDARGREGVKLWTDQYSNIFRVLGNSVGMERAREEHARKKEAERQIELQRERK